MKKYRLEKAKNTLSDAKKYFESATPESTAIMLCFMQLMLF